MTFDPAKWAAATQILTPLAAPETAVFLNTYSGDGVTKPWNGLTFARNGWTTVDLSQHIPTDAKSVFLQGLLIISHGTNNETANLTINLRPPSSTEAGTNYEGQVIEFEAGGGQRSPFAAWVSVENARFQFLWNSNSLGTWPDWSAFAVNLTLQAFTR